MNTASLFILLLVTGCCSQHIPEDFFLDEHSTPPKIGTSVRISFYALSTTMNFDNDILDIVGILTMMWTDKRKSGKVDDFIVFERLSNSSDYTRAVSTSWMPSLVYRIQAFNFIKGDLKRAQRLAYMPTGQFLFSTPVRLKMHCTQKSRNYPYDSYDCNQRVILQESNRTVRYYVANKPDSRGKIHSQGHIVGNSTCQATTKTFEAEDSKFNYQDLEFLFEVTRDSPRLITLLVVPIILLSFDDACLFIFGKTVLHQLALLPTYFLYLEDVSKTNTVYDWPPIVKFFFARFLSSLMLGGWTLFNCLRMPEKPSSFRLTSQALLNSWQKRMIFVILLTCFFHALLTVKPSGYGEDYISTNNP